MTKKVIVVTGASGGLGQACVSGLQGFGFAGAIVATGRSLGKLQEVYKGQTSLVLRELDPASEKSRLDLATFLHGRTNNITAIIHAHGVFLWDVPYSEDMRQHHQKLGLESPSDVARYLINANALSRVAIDETLKASKLYSKQTIVIHINSVAGSNDPAIVEARQLWRGETGYITSMIADREYCEKNGYVCLHVPMTDTSLTRAAFSQRLVDRAGHEIWPGFSRQQWTSVAKRPADIFDELILPVLSPALNK